MSNKRGTTIQISALKEPIGPTDKYGYKRMLDKLNKWAKCPKCNSILTCKNNTTFVCPKCGFKKPATQAPSWNDLEPIEDWVKKEQNKQPNI